MLVLANAAHQRQHYGWKDEIDLKSRFKSLSLELENLNAKAQRSVKSLLGLIVGDCVGLPYELRGGIQNRKDHDRIASNRNANLKQSVQDRVYQGLFRRGDNNIHARSYSDDTVCADLKMSSITHCAVLARKFDLSDEFANLWKLQLAGLLAWRFGEARGRLFQGAGKFTKDLLRTPSKRGKADIPSCEVPGRLPACKTWPREWFIDHAKQHLSGGGGSWGNGTVMSYAPQVLAERIMPAGNLPRPSARALECLASMHQHEHALFAHDLLHNILKSVQERSIKSCAQLAMRIRSSSCWKAVMKSKLDLPYPLHAFDEFLLYGDCSYASMMNFVRDLTGLEHPRIANELHAGYMTEQRTDLVGVRFGRLLRTLSNWDDDHDTNQRLRLPSGEDVKFSQRGLNSVLIAMWCCCRAESTWDWIARLLYVGGDTDTIGAICGQIASPLFPCADILNAFRDLAAVGICRRRPLSVHVAAVASLRYFERSLLFCKGHWVEHASGLRLVDPGLIDTASSETAEVGDARGIKRHAPSVETGDSTWTKLFAPSGMNGSTRSNADLIVKRRKRTTERECKPSGKPCAKTSVKQIAKRSSKRSGEQNVKTSCKGSDRGHCKRSGRPSDKRRVK